MASDAMVGLGFAALIAVLLGGAQGLFVLLVVVLTLYVGLQCLRGICE